jgi:hypothetical protein
MRSPPPTHSTLGRFSWNSSRSAQTLSLPCSTQNNIRCCIHLQSLLPHQRSCSGCMTNTNLSFRVNHRCSRRMWCKLSVILRVTVNVVALIGAVVVTGSAHCVLHGILRDTATTGPRRIVTSPCGRLQAKMNTNYGAVHLEAATFV